LRLDFRQQSHGTVAVNLYYLNERRIEILKTNCAVNVDALASGGGLHGGV
jgi:hypothetical protein